LKKLPAADISSFSTGAKVKSSSMQRGRKKSGSSRLDNVWKDKMGGKYLGSGSLM
jgi:hypothetical protein